MSIEETRNLFDWLLDRGLSLLEAAFVLTSLEQGNPLGVSLLEVFKTRYLTREMINEKLSISDWGNPIVP